MKGRDIMKSLSESIAIEAKNIVKDFKIGENIRHANFQEDSSKGLP